jgi:hypothetical protein
MSKVPFQGGHRLEVLGSSRVNVGDTGIPG